MQNIETLMKELNLGDEIISTTLSKIDFICSKYNYTSEYKRKTMLGINGNGDSNGNN